MILQFPNTNLKLKCNGTSFANGQRIGKVLKKEIIDYQKDHADFMVVGLAAPQIGLKYNVFAALGEIFINPKIIEKSTDVFLSKEGCCSLKSEYEISRPKYIVLQWLNNKRQYRRHKFSYPVSAIIEHEFDHLNGVLINDHGISVSPMSQTEKTRA